MFLLFRALTQYLYTLNWPSYWTAKRWSGQKTPNSIAQLCPLWRRNLIIGLRYKLCVYTAAFHLNLLLTPAAAYRSGNTRYDFIEHREWKMQFQRKSHYVTFYTVQRSANNIRFDIPQASSCPNSRTSQPNRCRPSNQYLAAAAVPPPNVLHGENVKISSELPTYYYTICSCDSNEFDESETKPFFLKYSLYITE